MSKSMRNWIIGTVVLLVIGSLLWWGLGNSGSPSPAITRCRVALLIPETGNLAHMGIPIRNVWELALERNCDSLKKDGIAIDLISIDSKGNPKDAVTGINRALAVDRADVVVSLLSGVTAATAPVVAKKGTFFIGMTVDPTFLEDNTRSAIRVFFSYKRQSELFAQICERRKWNKLLIFHSSDQASTYSMETILEPLLTASGKTFVQETFNIGQRDFKDIVAKHLNFDGQAIIIEGFGGEFPMLVSTIRETQRLKDLPILSSLGCMGVKPELQAQMVGVEFIAPRFVVKGNVYQKMRKAFSERYPTTVFSYTALYAYDAFDIIIFALRKARKTDGHSIFEALQGTVIPTMSDNYTFDTNGDFSPAMALTKFDDKGEIVFMEDIH